VELLGYDRAAIIGQSAAKFWAAPVDREYVLNQIAATGILANHEQQFITASGEIRTGLVSATVSIIDGERYLIASAIDITKRRRTEEALRLSEEMFAKAFHENQTAMFISHINNSVIVDVNDAFADMLSYTRDEVIGTSALSLNIWVDPHDREEIVNRLFAVGSVRDFEARFRKKSGEIRYCLTAHSILAIDGDLLFLGSMVDITERMLAEATLQASEEKFFKAYNLNPMAMLITSIANNTVLEVNDTFLTRNNLRRDQLLGLAGTYPDFCNETGELDDYTALILKEGSAVNFESKYRLPSGEIRTVLLSGTIIDWQGEDCILSISNDITELRHYQQEIARLDRLNLVGEMSACMAHEIRNPMTTVKGFLQLLEREDRFSQDLDCMELMIEEIDRANDIITQFLSLAKNKMVELKSANLNEKIINLWPLLQAGARQHDMSIQLEIKDIPDLIIDAAEIRQLILNLAWNGIEAMAPGGVLTIRTFQEQERVILAVQDQGSGISPENFANVGTPFFTTKPNGTGLGLAVCYSIAQRHKARIEFESGSQGTTFLVHFTLDNLNPA